jgi:excisionase family DNA binding protein
VKQDQFSGCSLVMPQPMNTSSANNITLENPPVSEDTKTSSPDSDLWTTKEVAKHLHVSLKTVFNLRKRGLPFVQLGGAVRFVPQEIRDYLVNSRGLSSHRLRQIARKGALI